MSGCLACWEFTYAAIAAAGKAAAARDRRDAGAVAGARIEADKIRRAYLVHRETHEAVVS